MARYNTVTQTTSISTTASLPTPITGRFTTFTGSTYTVTIGNPTLVPGESQSFYNSASGNVTLQSGGTGIFVGPGSSGTNNQVMPSGSRITVFSDGTNWVTAFEGGGVLTGTSATLTAGLALNSSGSITTDQTTATVLNATATTVNAFGAATTLAIGGASGTCTIGNATITLTNAATLNMNGANPTLASTSSGSLTLFDSALTTVNAFGASTNTRLGFTGTGTSTTFNISTAALTGSFTKTINIGTGGTTGSTTTINISSATNGTTNINGTLNATTINETSSIRLKENVNPITDALDSILQLVGVTYDRKDGSRYNEPGLVAEQVAEVLPNLVSRDEDGNPSGVNYTRVTAYLIEAIKSLKEEINDLKNGN